MTLSCPFQGFHEPDSDVPDPLGLRLRQHPCLPAHISLHGPVQPGSATRSRRLVQLRSVDQRRRAFDVQVSGRRFVDCCDRWCAKRERTARSFDFVKIREKSLKFVEV